MVHLKLYRFNKRLNSTRDPVNHSADLEAYVEGYFKIPTSILNPVIEMKNVDGMDFSTFNYAYVREFKRFYFISSISTFEDIWCLYLKEDFLATYHDSIQMSTQYVARSSTKWNPNIIDKAYKTVASSTNVYAESPSYGSSYVYRVDEKEGEVVPMEAINYFTRDITKGCFCVGILGESTGGVIYYLMNSSAFNQFLLNCFTLVPSNMQDFSGSALKNAIFDPMQYVTYCKWFPTMPLNIDKTSITSVPVGTQSVSVSTGNCYKATTVADDTCTMEFTLPVHPDYINDTNNYLKLSPYSQYNFFSYLFGDIPIDSTKVYGKNKIYVTWKIDYTSGKTNLKITTDYNYVRDEGHMVYNSVEDSGVTIPMSTLVMDWKAGLAITANSFLQALGVDVQIPKSDDYLRDIFNHTKNGTLNDWLSQAEYGTSESSMTGSNSKWSSPSDPHYRYRGSFANGIASKTTSRQLAAAAKAPIESGNAPTENVSLLGVISDFIAGAFGQVSTKGGISSFSSYSQYPFVYAWFAKQTPISASRFGRPLYEETSLELLSGYVLCMNAYISNFLGSNAESFEEPDNPLQSEIECLNGLLNSGIYLE